MHTSTAVCIRRRCEPVGSRTVLDRSTFGVYKCWRSTPTPSTDPVASVYSTEVEDWMLRRAAPSLVFPAFALYPGSRGIAPSSHSLPEAGRRSLMGTTEANAR